MKLWWHEWTVDEYFSDIFSIKEYLEFLIIYIGWLSAPALKEIKDSKCLNLEAQDRLVITDYIDNFMTFASSVTKVSRNQHYSLVFKMSEFNIFHNSKNLPPIISM